MAYRFNLLFIMKIYNVISIIYFEPITDPALDLYKRYFSISLLIIVNNKEEYKIERLIKKRRCRFGRSMLITQYLTK